MATIATWCGIRFVVSNNKTMLLNDMKESNSISIATHEALSRRQKIQWIGYDASEFSLSIVFDSMVCRKPYNEYMKLKDLLGHVSYFLIGNKRIGYHRWMLTSLSGAYERILPKGGISRIEATAKFTEYYDDNGGSD